MAKRGKFVKLTLNYFDSYRFITHEVKEFLNFETVWFTMNFMLNFFKALFNLLPAQTAYAHCDIPCGIYDPHNAQMAAHTVLRMTNLINETKGDIHKISRLTRVKEDHSELVKHDIGVIWWDYFKEEHLKQYPDLHLLVYEIMKLASKTKQEIDLEAANELISKVQEFSELFWKTKGRDVTRTKSGYPTEGEIVLPK